MYWSDVLGVEPLFSVQLSFASIGSLLWQTRVFYAKASMICSRTEIASCGII